MSYSFRMMIFFLALLIFSQAASASEFGVGPLVTSVVTGGKTLEPTGDFFRAILMNTEADSCLTLQKLNVRNGKSPKVLENRKLCAFKINSERYSLLPSEHQEATYANLTWNEFNLNFDLRYTSAAHAAPSMRLKCSADPRQKSKEFSCVRE